MIVRDAVLEDVAGICRVCSAGWRATYRGLLPEGYIERVIASFYNEERVRQEIAQRGEQETGWIVVADNDTLVGAGAGGMTAPHVGELFVLYVDPERRNQGIGSLILDRVIGSLRQMGARELWASVAKGNEKGISFYTARGFSVRGEQVSYASDPSEQLTSLRFCKQL
ncbi:MAG: GNAT family N-acetyltransferase [Bacillota bacterium]